MLESALITLLTGGGIPTFAVYFILVLLTFKVVVTRKDNRETMHWEAVQKILDRQDKDIERMSSRLDDCENDRADLRDKLEKLLNDRTKDSPNP
jgi:uncharacterized protein YhaN